jgi:RNA polymerase sigma factor (sigma-70 family)
MQGESAPCEELLATRLACWQATGCEIDLEALWREAEPFVSQVARRTLLGVGLRDPAACDDAISLVLNHLRRLPSRGVTGFDPARGAIAYLRWLSARRALDTARLLKVSRETPLSALPVPDKYFHCLYVLDGENSAEEMTSRLRQACEALDSRSRLVIEHHLAEYPQAETARALGVCEGTITRIRQKAIDRLRILLSDPISHSPMRKPR